MLVLFVTLTFVYDTVFLFFIHDSESDDNQFSGMQINVRRFSYFFVWISYFFRPVVILVLWKDSLDFRKIFRNKAGAAKQGDPSVNQSNPDMELARIMALYGQSV